MDQMKPISRVGSLREEAGLTQLELAQLLDVTENTIANWEKGRSGLEWIERIVKMCKIFQCAPDELIEYIPNYEASDSKTKTRKKSIEELRRLLGTHQRDITKNNKQKSSNNSEVEV